MNIKLTEILQKERAGVVDKIVELKKVLEAFDVLLLRNEEKSTEVVEIGSNKGELCSYSGCNAERDTDPKYKGSLCSEHRDKQSQYNADARKKVKAKKEAKKEIRKKVFKIVTPPTKQEAEKLIKQSKENEVKSTHLG